MKMFFGNRRPASPAIATRGPLGFTLVEMLAVVFIVGLLVALAFPVLSLLRDRAWRTRAHQQAMQAARAWNAYLVDQRSWPQQRFFDDESNASLKQLLLSGWNEMDSAGGGAFAMSEAVCRVLNYSRTYLEIDGEMLKHGLLDPWGQRLMKAGHDPDETRPWLIRVAIDHEHNGTVDYEGPDGVQTIRRPVIAWSVGPDGVSGTEDDVAIWPRPVQ